MLASPTGVRPHDQDSQAPIPPHLCAAPSALPHLWRRATSTCLHHPPLGICGSEQSTERLLSTPRPAAGVRIAPPFFLFLPLALFPGTDSDMERLGTSTRIDCLHYFLCMTLYAVSMLKNKNRKEEKSQQNQSTCFGQKKKKEAVFSVSDSEICCCLSVLLASVWPCVASMRYCPLWRILGEEEPHPQGFGGGTGSPKPSRESWVVGGAGLMGYLIQTLLRFSSLNG